MSSRLVDYFVVVGYECARSGECDEERSDGRAKIIQRFPSVDEDDDEVDNFDANMRCFCQPHKGWYLYRKQEAPTYFVSVLTDVRGQRKYLACLTFLEPYEHDANRCREDENDDDDDQSDSLSEDDHPRQKKSRDRPIAPSRLYSAKSLVIISRLEYVDLFKSCLSLVYACYVDKRHNSDNRLIEQIVGRLLSVNVPAPGTGLYSQFSLGADDKHIVQSAATLTVPTTSTCVYRLFNEIGIGNAINLVCSIMADFKIIFFSKSYIKLYEACKALEALLFPLKYTGVYVPVLPCFGSFLEFPAAPTPYIIGVHSSFRGLIEQMHCDSLAECVKCDLDSGLVSIPSLVSDLITSTSTDDKQTGLPVYLYESTLSLLYSILKRDVLHADELIETPAIEHNNDANSALTTTNQNSSNSNEVLMDKMIRAVFVRMFSQLFAGYRYCLLIVRINPKPVICFNKASFLSNHDLLKNEFMNKVLDSMSFQRFIEERGPSYRTCDVFDDLYADIQSDLIAELNDHDLDLSATNSSYYSSSSSSIYSHLRQIAHKLIKYEYPCYKKSKDTNTNSLKSMLFNSYVQSCSKIKPPTVDAYKRIHSETFPLLDSTHLNSLIQNRHESTNSLSSNSAISLHNTTTTTTTTTTNNNNNNNNHARNNMCRPHIVPYGPPIETVQNLSLIVKRLANINEKLDYYCGYDNLMMASSELNVATTTCHRPLETIENFVNFVFENNFKEAKKNLNSAYRALRSPKARLHLCHTLQLYVKKNQVILNNEQFDYVCKLMNEALENDTRLDEHGVAYSILPLSSAFYRKLNNNTLDQCVYTRIQHHDVWSNMLFWEMAFYTDVQRSIRPVYLTNEEFAAEQQVFDSSAVSASDHRLIHFRPSEKTALEICGEQMEQAASIDNQQRDAFIRNEQGIIRSHVLHYITQMVNMKIPLDINERMSVLDLGQGRNDVESIQQRRRAHTNLAHSRSFDTAKKSIDTKSNLNQSLCSESASVNEDVCTGLNTGGGVIKIEDLQVIQVHKKHPKEEEEEGEEGEEEEDGGRGEEENEVGEPQPNDLSYDTWRFVAKFVDRVCIEACLCDDQKLLLNQNLCDVIRMQIEMLDMVYTHSKLVPLRHKPKLDQLKPDNLLPGEILVEPSALRSYLVPDGHDQYSAMSTLDNMLIPAEGALYLTNYRVIFRGIPLNDSLINDSIITRSFPIASLIKEKKLTNAYKLINSSDLSNSILSHGIQMKSSTFQLIKIYFDNNDTSVNWLERIDRFRCMLNKCSSPSSVYEVFSLARSAAKSNNVISVREQTTMATMAKKETVSKILSDAKTDTFRTFAKSTLRKAGLMSKTSHATSSNQHGFVRAANRTPETHRKLMLTINNVNQRMDADADTEAANLDSLSTIEENLDFGHVFKMCESSLAYCDYIRQALVNDHDLELRICTLNIGYQLSKSLPALFLVPRQTSDECVRKNAKCHRQNRLPILVWKHPRLKSIVLRGSAFHAKGFLGALIKTSNNNQQTQSFDLTKDIQLNTSMDQDKYMNEILRLTTLDCHSPNRNAYPMTPITNRRSLFASKFEKAVKTIKNNYNFASNFNPVHAIANTNVTTTPSNVNKFNTISSSYQANKLNMKKNQNFNLNYNGSFDSSGQENQAESNLNDSLNCSFNSGNNARPHLNSSNSSSAKYFNSVNGSSRAVQPPPLYIICEKNQAKSLRNDWSKDTSRYIFIPVDIHEVKDTKNSFKKLYRACVPNQSVAETTETSSASGYKVSSASFGLNRLTSSNKISRKKNAESNKIQHSNGFLKQIHDSKWLDQIQLVMSIANTIVEKIEEGSSVMVCLEDGWDLTAQVVSLAELLLDPFYRTIDGFSLLVEREWLSMGHRFTRRNNHTADDQTGFAPIFIQFLDCVHQCLNQYPNAFEFNYFYLEFLAYHSVSNRFATFLLDNEFERAQYGLLKSEPIKRTFSPEQTHVTYKQYNQLSSDTKCIWDYILKVHYNSARFFNFNYQPGVFNSAPLRPGSEIYKLKLWNYYVKDSLCTGPLYDYDLINTASYLNSKDDTCDPVGLQSATDLYEQLNEILPSQYELLLKQIIVKYKLNRFENDCDKDINLYISSVLSKSSEEIDQAKDGFRINWKNLWDYFIDLAERKLLNDLFIEDEIGDYSNCFMSVTKPYLTTVDAEASSQTQAQTQTQIAHNKHLTLLSSHSQSSGHSASTNYSTSTSSAISSTPPFPNYKKSIFKQHQFEFYVFSSVNICHLCNSNFKSNTEFIGLKCRNCNINCHEQCKQDYQLARSAILSECHGNDTNDLTRNTAPITVLVDNQLESSSYSVHTNTSTSSSSCSTTPNSNFSQNYYNKINQRTKPSLLHQYSIANEGKIDADIGSACAVGLHYKETTNTLVEANRKSYEQKEEETILKEEKTEYNYINWSGGSQNTSPTNEHQTYAGYLKKQGALFKQWKERYFVLDSVKHQLRYYDSASDLHVLKGVIDLSDVESINQGISSALMNQQGNEKKMVNFSNLISDFSDTNSKNCFELKTSKRIYYFLAKSPQDAYKWVKQLEMCCLDS